MDEKVAQGFGGLYRGRKRPEPTLIRDKFPSSTDSVLEINFSIRDRIQLGCLGNQRGKKRGRLRRTSGKFQRLSWSETGSPERRFRPKREARGRKEKTDARDPAVSEEERRERGRAEGLTRVHAGRGKSRKGTREKREAS